VLVIVFLTGCSEGIVTESSEKYPTGYQVVTVQLIDGYSAYELRHIKTGCHFTFSSTGSVQPMFIEVNGVSVPYCTED
jgi:hypothetical protein